jgi:hypothetical protein
VEWAGWTSKSQSKADGFLIRSNEQQGDKQTKGAAQAAPFVRCWEWLFRTPA